jgi:hypothetical protein
VRDGVGPPVRGLGPFVALLLLAAPAWGFDANGVQLGAKEADVRKVFPSAHCRPLEWKSTAAERRCDDAQVVLAGARARITFYLKADSVQAFDARFEERDLKRVEEALRKSYGDPFAESRDKLERRNGEVRTITKIRWEKGDQRAVLTSQEKRKRVDLNVWRGKFDEEIYRIR